MSGLQAAPGQVWWSESRPADGGRQAVLGARTGAGEAGGPLTGVREVGPPAVSVRSRVHEYGGGAWVVAPDDDALFFVDATDQAVWCLEGAGAPHRLSGLDEDEPCRHGDLGVAPGRPWVLAVRERHGRDGVENEIVAVPAAGDGPSCVLVGDRDFFAAPRADAEGPPAGLAHLGPARHALGRLAAVGGRSVGHSGRPGSPGDPGPVRRRRAGRVRGPADLERGREPVVRVGPSGLVAAVPVAARHGPSRRTGLRRRRRVPRSGLGAGPAHPRPAPGRDGPDPGPPPRSRPPGPAASGHRVTRDHRPTVRRESPARWPGCGWGPRP